MEEKSQRPYMKEELVLVIVPYYKAALLIGNSISFVSTLTDCSKAERLHFKTGLLKNENPGYRADILRDDGVYYGNQEILAKYSVRPDFRFFSKLKFIKWRWTIYRYYEHFCLAKSLRCLGKWA